MHNQVDQPPKGGNMRFLKKFKDSLINFKAYAEFAKNSFGSAMLYLIILSLICGTFYVGLMTFKVTRTVQNSIQTIMSKVPEFVFKDGTLSIDGKMPIILTGENNLIYIDTSDKTSPAIANQYTNYDEGIFVFKDTILRKKYFKTEIFDLSYLSGLTIDKYTVLQIISKYARPFIVGFFLLGQACFFGSKLFGVFLLSAIGLLLLLIIKTKISYRDLFKISLYASTLPIIVSTLLRCLSFNWDGLWIIHYVLGSLYLAVALKTLKE
jgi:hypothetical protein